MASDLMIEIFGYYCFNEVLLMMDMKIAPINILDIYGEECLKVENYSEACELNFLIVIYCRQMLFSEKYFEELVNEKAIKWNLSEFYDHVTRVCDRDDWFGHLTIFERMFATCTFVVYLCAYIYEHSFIDVLTYGPIIWAMYFDKFTEKFYEEGGWNELKRVAGRYNFVLDFLCCNKIETTTESVLSIVKKSSVNYCKFKKAVKSDNCKFQHKDTFHISKLWIKFHIEHFEEYGRFFFSGQTSMNVFEIDKLLENLKLLCHPAYNYDSDNVEIFQEQVEEALCSTGMISLKTFGNREEITSDKDLKNKNLKINMTPCIELPTGRKGLGTQLQSACLTSDKKILDNEFLDKIENVEDNFSETRMTSNKSGEFLDAYSSNRCNNLYDETIGTEFVTSFENSPDTFPTNENELVGTSSRNEKNPHKSLNSGIVSTSVTKDDTQCSTKNHPKSLTIPTNVFSENKTPKSCNAEVIPKNTLESSVNAKHIDECNDNTEINYAVSTNQITAAQCEKDAMPKNLPTSKDFLAVNEVTTKNDGGIYINKILDKPREEHNDPEIRTDEEANNDSTELNSALSTKQITETQCEKDTMPKNLLASKDSLAVNEIKKKSEGRINTNKKLDELREEQNDQKFFANDSCIRPKCLWDIP